MVAVARGMDKAAATVAAVVVLVVGEEWTTEMENDRL